MRKKRSVISSKSSGGGGFRFEYAVAARLMICMLTDTPPLADPLGRLVKMEFQARAWSPFDDILLHLEEEGGPRLCGLSVRSNRQFTQQGAPQEFVDGLWRQALVPDESGFRLERDKMGFITSPLAGRVSDALHAVLRAAGAQDELRTVPTPRGRIQTAILESFKCPATLAIGREVNLDTFRQVLRSVVHKEFDFEQQNSSSLTDSIAMCRAALAGGDAAEAGNLWEILYELASAMAPNEGAITRSSLFERLRGRFDLRALPHHEPDWRRLERLSGQEISSIRDRVGNDLILQREAELGTLTATDSRLMVLHGESGVGKTVVAKWWAESQTTAVRVWWLSADTLDDRDMVGFQQSLGLRNPLSDLLAAAPNQSGCLIFDGIDKIYKPRAFRALVQLLKWLPPSWRVLLVCQSSHWERVRHAMRTENFEAQWTPIEIGPPVISEDTWNGFSNLRPLVKRTDLRSLISRPKYLDSLLLRFDPVTYQREWVGESDLIEWFWRNEVESQPNGAARAAVVKKLGSSLGDTLQLDMAADEFTPSDQEYIESLVADRICRRKDERITIAHDAIGNWARQRVLLGRIDELPQFLADRSDSPLWLASLRLLGIHLLEQDSSSDRWMDLLKRCAALQHGERAQDSLLEAAIFVENGETLLNKIWHFLTEEKGRFLIRMLNRFVHTGSIPQPYAALIPDELSIHLTDVRHRVPVANYWPGLIRALHSHREELITLAPTVAAKIVGCWLENGPLDGRGRREAAEIALAGGRWALKQSRDEKYFLGRGEAVQIYRAALLAATEIPSEVAVFARDAAYRLPDQLSSRRYIEVTTDLGLDSYSGYYPEPWPIGPAEDLDHDFQRAVLDNATLGPLMRILPEDATEVLLAALVDAPQEPDPRRRDDPFFLNKLSLDNASDYSLANPLRPPFLSLINANPSAMIKAIVALTNFAAERWSEIALARTGRVPEVRVRYGSTERSLIGDFNVFTWYRLGACPNSLASALMALEFCFAHQIPEESESENLLDELLSMSNNVAIAGLLCAVGCQRPKLFLGVLSPLMTAPEFFDWERARRVAAYLDPSDSQLPEDLTTRQWDTQPWRRRGLDEIAPELFRDNEEFRILIDPIVKRWEQRLSDEDASPRFHWLVEQLAPLFRVANYRKGADGELIEFVVPEELAAREAERQDRIQSSELPSTFVRACRARLLHRAPLDEGHLEGFWQMLQRIANLEVVADDEFGVNRKETCYCAAAAVLFILHRPWLKAQPEREAWLRAHLTSCVLEPPPAARWDDDYEISVRDWSAYSAVVMPVLWQEAPDDPVIRRLVARLATYRKYNSVELFFGSAASWRDELGKHFFSILDLACDWAIERRRADSHRFGQPSHDPSPWLEREINAFVEGSRLEKPVPWQNLGVELEEPLPWRPAAPRRLRYNFDVGLWRSIFHWLPPLHAVQSPAEHTWNIDFWSHHLGVTIRHFNGEVGEDERQNESIPGNGERWLLERVAGVVLDLPVHEEAARLWKPILSMVPRGPSWISHFLGALLSFADQNEVRAKVFLDEWPRMVRWALDEESWKRSGSGWPSFVIARAWRSLIGLENIDGFLRHFKDRLTGWESLYSAWAKDWLRDREGCILFCRLLERKEARPLLAPGLVLLSDSVAAALLKYQPEVSEALGRLLLRAVRLESPLLFGNTVTLAAFRTLLNHLSEVQHPRAVEIESALTS